MSKACFRTEIRLAAAISVCLVVASGNVGSAEVEFAFPTLKSQPVVIQRLILSAEQYAVLFLNRSSKTIRGLDLTIAGTACTRPYKPAWPSVMRDNLDVLPGSYASVDIPKNVIADVAARSFASCGHAVATEVAVTSVRFADGSTWDLGDAVRAGEPYEH